MKPASSYLGQELQVFLLRQGAQLDELARQVGLSAVGLSNLIHGRRQFRDETLQRLSETPLLIDGGFTLRRLKALRAMDDYSMEELIVSVLEYVKADGVGGLPEEFFEEIQQELARFRPAGADVVQQLAEYFQTSR
jgi:transcriptional regulator with XRE-family HTH domain